MNGAKYASAGGAEWRRWRAMPTYWQPAGNALHFTPLKKENSPSFSSPITAPIFQHSRRPKLSTWGTQPPLCHIKFKRWLRSNNSRWTSVKDFQWSLHFRIWTFPSFPKQRKRSRSHVFLTCSRSGVCLHDVDPLIGQTKVAGFLRQTHSYVLIQMNISSSLSVLWLFSSFTLSLFLLLKSSCSSDPRPP